MRWPITAPVFVVFAIIALTLPAHAAPPAVQGERGQNLIAYGNEEAFWIARMTAPGTGGSEAGAAQTQVMVRLAGTAEWAELRQVGPRAISLASRGGQLAMLLEDGEVLLLSTSSATSGPRVRVPGAELIALGTEDTNLWALASVPGGIAALRPPPPASMARPAPPAASGNVTTVPESGTTQPASTTTRAATTRLATMPTTRSAAVAATSRPDAATRPYSGPFMSAAPSGLALLRLGATGWEGVCDIPPEVAGSGDLLSFAMIDRAPHVAVRPIVGGQPAGIHVHAFRGERWSRVATVRVGPDVRAFDLVEGASVPVLAVHPASAAEPSRVYLLRGDGPATTTAATQAAAPPASVTQPATRDITPSSAPTSAPAVPSTAPADGGVALESTRGADPSQRAVGFATGRIRAVYYRDGEPYEQAFDTLNAAPAGPPFKLNWTQPSPFLNPYFWRGVAVTIAMVLAIVASFRRRDQMRVAMERLDKLKLAPLGRRAGAGAIDALPVLVGLGWAASGHVSSSTSFDYAGEVVYAVAIVAYVLYTLMAELLVGRTVGKMIFGLRVVNLDGTTPSTGQRTTRNLLRVIDAGLFMVPILLIPFSPLRQRPGDAAAGTLVVTREDAVEEKKDQDEEE